jgi:uncharacterized protein YoxC
MGIDVSKYSDEELLSLLNSLSDKIVRELLSQMTGLMSRIKGGWRDINKVPLPMLKSAAISYSHTKYSALFYTVLNQNMNAWDERVEELKEECVQEGVENTSAYAIAIRELLLPQFIEEYCKLKGFAPETVQEIKKSISLIALISHLSSNKTKTLETEKKVGKNAGNIELIDQKASENLKTIEGLKKSNEDLSGKIEEIGRENAKLTERIKALEENDSVSGVSKGLQTLGKKEAGLEETVKDLERAFDDAQKELNGRFEKQIVDLEKAQEKRKTEAEETNYVVELVNPGDYDKDDGSGLEDIVGDVSFGLLSSETKEQKHFALYKSFILNALYGDKLLFASKDKAVHLAKVISGILSGQGYYRIGCDGDVKAQELYQYVSKRINDSGFSVFLIDGFLGSGDFSATAKKLRSLSGKAKFIFSINDPKSVRFLSIDLLEDFLFFDASINYAGRSEYTYICQLPPREFESTNLVGQCLTDFGMKNLEAPKTIDDGLGIIRYSYLPFFAYRDGKSVGELLDLISDPETQAKLNEVVDE